MLFKRHGGSLDRLKHIFNRCSIKKNIRRNIQRYDAGNIPKLKSYKSSDQTSSPRTDQDQEKDSDSSRETADRGEEKEHQKLLELPAWSPEQAPSGSVSLGVVAFLSLGSRTRSQLGLQPQAGAAALTLWSCLAGSKAPTHPGAGERGVCLGPPELPNKFFIKNSQSHS